MHLLVVDTNIFINAIFSNKFKDDEKIINFEDHRKVRFAFSRQTKDELYKIISRTVEKHNLFECSEFFELTSEIIGRSFLISTPVKLPKLSSDKGDQPFIELAVDAKADYLITNDKQNGLLSLRQYNGVKIVTPQEYIKITEKENRRKRAN